MYIIKEIAKLTSDEVRDIDLILLTVSLSSESEDTISTPINGTNSNEIKVTVYTLPYKISLYIKHLTGVAYMVFFP